MPEMRRGERLRVLVLSRNYPNNVLDRLGLWVERPVQRLAACCEMIVVAPVPYCPPLPGLPEYTRFRRVEPYRQDSQVTVHHPRIVLGPGRSLYHGEALSYGLGVRRCVDRIWWERPFDLIHAHFSYPDGVVGAWLGRRYGVPVVVTEHAPWRPWMDQCARVRRQAVWAAGHVAFHIAVSRSVQDTIAHFTGRPERIRVIPIGVDGEVFTPPTNGSKPKPDQLAYVGFINYNKGIDLLLRAFPRLLERRPGLRLVLVGGSLYRHTRLQEEQLRRQAEEMGLQDRVRFTGGLPPAEVARTMRESALLVLPSRAESFGAVLIEALACGTPVVATRCGGPEDIVTDDVGVLVRPEDPAALAQGIERVLQHHHRYEPARLREYALQRFSWERVAQETVSLYHEALEQREQPEVDQRKMAAGVETPR